MEFKHKSVLLNECLEGLSLTPDGLYFDGTFGGGGHSREILLRTSSAKLIACDLDSEALANAENFPDSIKERLTLVKGNFKDFKQLTENFGYGNFNGILLDLGVSSYQIDNRERGFSYLDMNAELDMRMNRESPLSAVDVLNNYKEDELKNIISEYGEEKFATMIAKNIVKFREKEKITTCGQLVGIIEKSIPAKFRRDGHPAKRTFQAIRIEVNGELKGIDAALYDMIRGLKKGGRLAVITFHSLEDRIVKRVFKDLATGCTCNKNLPICVCGRHEEVVLVNKKPIVSSGEEADRNPRAKSAKLRIVERL